MRTDVEKAGLGSAQFAHGRSFQRESASPPDQITNDQRSRQPAMWPAGSASYMVTQQGRAHFSGRGRHHCNREGVVGRSQPEQKWAWLGLVRSMHAIAIDGAS